MKTPLFIYFFNFIRSVSILQRDSEKEIMKREKDIGVDTSSSGWSSPQSDQCYQLATVALTQKSKK